MITRSVYNTIKLRVKEYCDLNNSIPMTRAYVVNFHRGQVQFNVLRHMREADKSGNETGCGCEYCVTLQRYAGARKFLHRLYKQLYYEDNYQIGPLTTLEDSYKKIEKQEDYCVELRNKLVTLGENLEIPKSVKRKE